MPPRKRQHHFVCKTGDKLNEKTHAAHLLTAGPCQGSGKQILPMKSRDDLFPQKKNFSLSLFPLFLCRGPSKSKCTSRFFLKRLFFRNASSLTCWLFSLLEMGLNQGGEKQKKQPESALNVHQDERGASDGKTDDIRCRLSPPSSFCANQFPPNDKNTCYFCLPD